MKEIKMSEIVFQTGLVFNYSKAEDLKIIVDKPVPEGVEIKIATPSDIKLIIDGDVGKGVKIKSPERKVDVIINGNMKERASILLNKGNIIVKNVSSFAQITTQSGSIMADTVSDKAYLDTQLGCIISENVENGGQLEVGSGFITANTVGDAKLRAKCGKVYIKQDNRDVHNKGWEKFSVTLPTNSAAETYDKLNNSLSEMNVTDNNEIMNVFNEINLRFKEIDQSARNPVHVEMPGITVDIGDASRVKFGDRTTTNYCNTPPHRPTTSSRRNGNASRSSGSSSSSRTSYTNVPTQGFDVDSFCNAFRSFDRAFGTNISNDVSQAAASGECNVTRLPNAENLHFGNTYHIDVNQSPQRQTTASRGTGESANSNQRSAPQTQQATAPSSEGRRSAPPAYDGESASAATANVEPPPAYSEMPRENEQTIAETIHDPNVSQPHTQRTRR